MVSCKKFKSYKLDIFKELTANSKDIYNKGLYNIRQHFFKTKEYLSYGKNDLLVKSQFDTNNIEKPYYRLQSNCSQQVLKNVDKSFNSFFALLKKKSSGQYEAKVNIPKYLPKDGHFKVVFTKSAFKIVGNQVRLSLPSYLKKELKNSKLTDGYIYTSIPKNIVNKSDIQEVHLIPNEKGSKFHLAFIYKKKENVSPKSKDSYLSIDLGVDNIVSIFNSNSCESILICGKEIKSINRFLNYKKSNLQQLNKKIYNKEWSKQIENLTTKRNNLLKDKLHKISNYIINYSIENQLETIVIGLNKEWKKDSNIGKRNNQNFNQIPHSKLIEYLEYKGELNGIKVVIQEESYTSKVDSLGLEELPTLKDRKESLSKTINPKTNQKYLGKRVKRGLYQSSIGKLINADINGAINILRKYIKTKSKQNFLIQRILSSGQVFCPVKVRI
jgi:IS605 OrfB family transposase